MSAIGKETELYGPIANYLAEQGYTVRGEVNDCDIAAIKGEDLILVELKRNFSVDLLIQATRGQKAADSVYVAIPRPAKGLKGPHWQGVLHLLRRLELGLILVQLGSRGKKVEIALHPTPFTRKRQTKVRKAIIREIEGRSLDLNQGGSVACKLMTAYRENAIQIACLLMELGPQAPKQLRDLGTGPKTQAILYRNVYGWFERSDKGYRITDRGLSELSSYPEVVEIYKAGINRGDV